MKEKKKQTKESMKELEKKMKTIVQFLNTGNFLCLEGTFFF